MLDRLHFVTTRLEIIMYRINLLQNCFFSIPNLSRQILDRNNAFNSPQNLQNYYNFKNSNFKMNMQNVVTYSILHHFFDPNPNETPV